MFLVVLGRIPRLDSLRISSIVALAFSVLVMFAFSGQHFSVPTYAVTPFLDFITLFDLCCISLSRLRSFFIYLTLTFFHYPTSINLVSSTLVIPICSVLVVLVYPTLVILGCSTFLALVFSTLTISGSLNFVVLLSFTFVFPVCSTLVVFVYPTLVALVYLTSVFLVCSTSVLLVCLTSIILVRSTSVVLVYQFPRTVLAVSAIQAKIIRFVVVTLRSNPLAKGVLLMVTMLMALQLLRQRFCLRAI